MPEVVKFGLTVGAMFVVFGIAIMRSKDFLWNWSLWSRKARNFPEEKLIRTPGFDQLMTFYGWVSILLGLGFMLWTVIEHYS